MLPIIDLVTTLKLINYEKDWDSLRYHQLAILFSTKDNTCDIMEVVSDFSNWIAYIQDIEENETVHRYWEWNSTQIL